MLLSIDSFGTIVFLFIVFDAVLVVFFIWALSKALAVRPELTPRKAAPPAFTAKRLAVQEAWNGVLTTFGKGTIENMKIAIINADKLIDTMLKDAGFTGDHMVDRLKQIPAARLASLERLYRAHRVRNNIVHTPDFTVNAQTARAALEDYAAFLKELGYID
jgi:hypothetical protein